MIGLRLFGCFVYLLCVLFSAPIKAENTMGHEGQPAKKGPQQIGPEKPAKKQRWDYRQCKELVNFKVSKAFSVPSFSIVDHSPSKNNRRFQLMLSKAYLQQSGEFDGSPEPVWKSPLFFQNAKPRRIGSFKVWESAVPTKKRQTKDINGKPMPFDFSDYKYITYVESTTKPIRKIFIVRDNIRSRETFSANKDRKGPGTYQSIQIFDNFGNFAKLGSEVDSSQPPKKIFQVHSACQGKDGDGFGYRVGTELLNAEDPILDTQLPELPGYNVKALYRTNKVSQMNDPAVRKAYFEKLRAKMKELEKNMAAIENGKNKNSSLEQLRKITFQSVQFVKPKMPKAKE